MKALVVSDSAYGNTWSIASAIAEALGDGARAVHAGEAAAGDLDDLDLLVVGSPTQGGRPLKSVTDFLRGLQGDAIKGVNSAAFDTRVEAAQGNFAMRLLFKVIGFAAPKIARELSRLGARQLVPPEGFIVDSKEGPLRAGETERASEWARHLQTAEVR